MNSWVYVFSKFTSEALLAEAFLIFLLLCGYTAFWVIRKRRYGAVKADLPSGPVKIYLSELIDQAEQLRLQLFGLLSAGAANRILIQSDPRIGIGGGAQIALPTSGVDPDLAKKLIALEEKIADQAQALEGMTAEKSNLEKQLNEIKSGAGGGNIAAGSGSSENAGNNEELTKRIKELEARLEEYSVIEDDLANLKRLQQENALLKSTLDSKGIPAPLTTDTPPPAAAEAAVSESAPIESAATDISELDPEPAAEAPAESAPVEASEPSNEAALAADTTEAPALDPEVEKSEADLVAEFEKMLKG